MIKKVKYGYEIETAGLGGKMYFTPGSSCGKIRRGISIDISIMRGGWNISLMDAWKMVLVSTVAAVQCRAWEIYNEVFAT